VSTLVPGQALLHYRIVDRIGAGGMGEVWRATDTSLGRDVAVKLLPPSVASDAERLARFEREAKLLASLSHPGIAAVYGLHQADGVRFIAMEFVDGEDLADRLARGPLAVDEAIDVARQVADAVEVAHEHGIVHRDLKPANVVRTRDGAVKVLDFGLAKALEPGSGSTSAADPMLSPTLTSAGTAAGVILGTAAYMSPEQARGRPVDRRADVWAFGAFLFEMLTGERAFGGETVSDTLAAILTRDPDWSRLPAGTPPRVAELLRRCLDRDPRRRLRDIGEARVLLEAPGAGEPDSASSAPAARTTRRWVAPAMAIAGAIVAAVAVWTLKPEPPRPASRRVALASPIGDSVGRSDPRISPDGSHIAYAADGRLWIQALDQLTPRPVPGGEGGGTVAWSPDGGSIAFAVGSRLFRARVDGDPVLIAETFNDIGDGGGALSWGDDGELVYATGDNDLFEVPVTGGTPRSILAPVLADETDFHEPSVLPGGRGIVYVVHRSPEGLDTLEVLAGGVRKVIYRETGAALAQPVYSPTGHILYDRGDVNAGVWALPFSLDRLEATGPPVLVTAEGSGASVSRDRTLLYRNRSLAGGHQLVVVDREGEVVETIGDRMVHIDNASLSPDETRLAVCATEGRETDLWVFDLARGSRGRLVRGAECGGRRGQIAWSPDGSRVVFGDSARTRIRRHRVDGKDEDDEVVEGLQPTLSGDGRMLAFLRESEQAYGDIWWMRTDGVPDARPIVATPAREDYPRLSPDGTLLAFVSDETGRSEVYLRDVPEGAATWSVSEGGGESPRWSRSGDRLFYLKSEVLYEVRVQRGPDTRVFDRAKVFAVGGSGLGPDHGYDVFGEGERFVTVRQGNSAAPAGDLVLVTDWRGP